jgi:IclR family acetate operon transcriptional repressor
MAENATPIGVSQLSALSGIPLPTVHRLVSTLTELGYLRQERSRRYVLSPRLIRLGDSSERTLTLFARPRLTGLVDELGETANLAMLDGDQIVYLTQVPSRYSVRMFTEIGRRMDPHCTAAGKAIMAGLPPGSALGILKRTGMPSHTETTITDPDRFITQLAEVTRRGYALDEGEQENGVRCIAVAVHDTPVRLAISLSGPANRMTDELLHRAVPLLTEAARGLSADLA